MTVNKQLVQVCAPICNTMLIFSLELHERLMGSVSAASNRHSENKRPNCPSQRAILCDYYVLSGLFELAEASLVKEG